MVVGGLTRQSVVYGVDGDDMRWFWWCVRCSKMFEIIPTTRPFSLLSHKSKASLSETVTGDRLEKLRPQIGFALTRFGSEA
ncbi:unnamed protein product [Lactuca virosa]|uniref:Uncharacterized protein n=1 Tax=Lactuca virosa TaxID=75947 RepID=A0AAU9MHW1_9ASTR|nr:unnamed protein product [Lactuca virosa]